MYSCDLGLKYTMTNRAVAMIEVKESPRKAICLAWFGVDTGCRSEGLEEVGFEVEVLDVFVMLGSLNEERPG